MNNLVNIFFTIVHYSIYSALGYIAFKKFIRPYLLQEQKDEASQELELNQRLMLGAKDFKKLELQVNYIKTLFKKILEQSKESQKNSMKIEAEAQAQIYTIQTEYVEQQRAIQRRRQIQELYRNIAPGVAQQLKSDLIDYYRDHNQLYMKRALEMLQRESQKELQARK